MRSGAGHSGLQSDRIPSVAFSLHVPAKGIPDDIGTQAPAGEAKHDLTLASLGVSLADVGQREGDRRAVQRADTGDFVRAGHPPVGREQESRDLGVGVVAGHVDVAQMGRGWGADGESVASKSGVSLTLTPRVAQWRTNMIRKYQRARLTQVR